MALMKPLDWWKRGDDVVCTKVNSQANLLNSSPLNGGPLSDIKMVGMPSAVKSSLRWLMVLKMMCRCHWEDVWELAEVICND